MAIIVEDGTIVENANSLVTAAETVAFAALRGITITEQQAAKHLILGMDLFNVYEDQMPGTRASVEQSTPFPRKGFYINDIEYEDNVIPREAKIAQMHAAIASFNGVELMPVQQNGKVLVEKTVGPIKKKWAYSEGQSTLPGIPQFEFYMNLLLVKVSGLTVGRA